jgi:DNA-binding FadR family transcriptional regulator
MALKPVARRLVPDDVFDQLLGEVVEGDLAAGDPLPSERRLSELLGVSRPAVREALQRLSQARLVEVRHGGSTTVRDYRRFAGLDLLPRLLVRGGELDPRVGQSILEARQAVAPAVAALAAGNTRTDSASALSAAVSAIADAEGAEARQYAALEFWDAVVDAADSIVFRLMFNSLRLAYEPTISALGPVMEAEVDNVAGYRALADAIAAGDAEGARQRAEELLRPAAEAISALLARLDETGPNETDDETPTEKDDR